MKKIFILFILFTGNLLSQSFAVFNPDTSTFPIMRAKFFVFDKDGKQITNFNTKDFEITENGEIRKVLSVKCPAPKPPQALSSVLVMDVSGSMSGSNIALAQEGAKAWIRSLPLGKSECAITTFDTQNYFVQDFTTDRNKLENKILNVYRGGGTDYNTAFTSPMAGGILVARTGKFKKVIIILSDGQPNFEPNTDEIIKQAEQFGITVFSVTLGYRCPQCLKSITEKTGGQWFEKVINEEQAREVYLKILDIAQGGEPCTIEWESEKTCPKGITLATVAQKSAGIVTVFEYLPPSMSFVSLLFEPNTVKFYKTEKDTCTKVKITAMNGDFNISSITLSNPNFKIEPSEGFNLKDGETLEANICYYPTDSGYNYCKINFVNNQCPANLAAAGGFPGKRPSFKTLKLIHPNGGEVFVAGTDTVITWEGVLPDENVFIEYSTDNGTSWMFIEKKAKGLCYKWRVPNTPSNKCLARVTARAGFINSDYPEVKICNQVWMSTNLDVEYYRNGDPIPEIRDSITWANATYGAWCYYNNDPVNDSKYGKLYNYYAVNDPRGLAPDGWHIPSDKEWSTLINCIGGDNNGGKLKSIGIVELGDGLWRYPNNNATNITGFSGHPGGYRDFTGKYWNFGYQAIWWCNEGNSQEYSSAWYLINYSPKIANSDFLIKYGFSVRCIKD